MKVFTPLQRIWMLGIQLGCLVLTFFATQLCKAQELNAPLSTSNAYNFTGLTVGNSVELPTNYPNSWFILNPQQGEKIGTFTVQEDENSIPYLSFEGNNLSETTFLCFKIGTMENGEYKPYDLTPQSSNVVIPREIVLSMRFAPTSVQAIETLRKLYKTADDRIQENVPLAAKLGVYVGEDGYFYVARVKATETDTIDNFLEYAWVKSNVSYADVGGGRVYLKIESYTYHYEGHQSAPEGVTAYSIYVHAPDDKNEPPTDSIDWKCLTTNIGYTWEMEADRGYTIDFGSEGQWIYAIDATVVDAAYEPFTSWNSIGFSADAGGLYGAWMEERDPIQTLQSPSLKNFNVGGFESFLDLSSSNYTLFADWVSRYDVDLTQNLDATTTLRSMALSNGDGLTERTFNAFLLDMDPTNDVQQKLYVKAVAPKANKMVLTIDGPASSNLANATKRAGRLYVARATTLATLAEADYVALDAIPNASLGYEKESVLVTLPRTNDDGEEMPFIKVELRAVE